MVSFNGKSHPASDPHSGGKIKQLKIKALDLAENYVSVLCGDDFRLHVFLDIHYSAITYMPSADEIRWAVYRILDYSEEPSPLGLCKVPVYPLAEDPNGGEGTVNPAEAAEFLRVQATRKGCVNFMFQQEDTKGEKWTHVCSGPELKSVGVLLDRIYEISQRIFKGDQPHPQ